MSHISKALDKYKKERNRSSAQIFNLYDAKATEPALNKGKDRSTRDGVNADAATPSVQPYPPQKESIDSAAAASGEIVNHQAEHREAEGAISGPHRKPHFVLADKQPEQSVSTGIEAKEKASHGEDQAAVSASLAYTGINLDRIDPNLVSIVDPHCIQAEMFKVLRDRILFPKLGKPPKSILVTSAASGEGKSFIASNLAINLAHDFENHVLLVDCDMRRPTQNNLFGLGMVKGLSEHLANGNELTELLIKTGLGNLSLLASGKPPANPSELLSSEKMANLIEELKNRYDDRFLVIDSPPPNKAPETAAIAKLVYAVIVVINYRSTPIHLIEEMLDSLGREKIIGAVVNRYDSLKSTGKTYRGKINTVNFSVINAWRALKNLYYQRF